MKWRVLILARQAGQAVRAFRQGRAGRSGLGFNPKQMVYTTRLRPAARRRQNNIGDMTRLLGGLGGRRFVGSRRGVPQRTK